MKHPHPTGLERRLLLCPVIILTVAWFHAKAYGDACNNRIGVGMQQLLGAAAAGHSFPEAHGLAHPVAQAHEPVYLLLAECSRLLCGSAPANSKGYLDTEVSAQQLFAESSNKPRIFLINNWAA